MKHAQTTGLVIAILIAAAAAGFGVYTWMQPSHRPVPPASVAETSAPPPVIPTMSAAEALTVPMNDLQGRPHSLDDWRGKVLLVNFWATWCPPCREEVPLLVKMQAKYAAQGLQIVGIATDEQSEQDVREFLKRTVVNYPILMGGGHSADIVNALGGDFIGLPVSVVLEPDGSVFRINAGAMEPRDAENLVRAALKLPALPAPKPTAITQAN
ncbi:MAG: redoxin family protein [Gammaproteobacteria bacterium]|nr:redoxin family protein [Gammaproteobacteria bacterium]MDE1888117.1 redoxin family protein [Gammaproteobacteria bacterium]MDE2024393.1 redoxin family protein [Gammaproteobacteria bacterium]MDE2139867.1 redoxin family protein [Gammaproteobacteria bacterium]MDE2273378.1 redoxin family protein [Gammaproteobacteria bacterium]